MTSVKPYYTCCRSFVKVKLESQCPWTNLEEQRHAPNVTVWGDATDAAPGQIEVLERRVPRHPQNRAVLAPRVPVYKERRVRSRRLRKYRPRGRGGRYPGRVQFGRRVFCNLTVSALLEYLIVSRL